MATVTISAKGFAEFVLAGPSKKATIVRNMLRPKSTESQVVVRYYARAIGIIRIFHARGNDRKYLADEVQGLEAQLLEAPTPQSRAKLENNLRAVLAYVNIYGDRKRKILPRPRIYYTSGQVRLSASPDMAIEEGGRVKLIKLGVTKKGDRPDVIRLLLRIVYQAAATRFDMDPRDVIYFDVSSGARVRGTRDDADLAVTIDKACEEMEGMI